MSVCPSCSVALIEEASQGGKRWLCTHCGGAAEGRDLLVSEAVADTVGATTTGGRLPCPLCGAAMGKARAETDPPGGVGIDECSACNIVWLSANARASIPLRLSPDRAEALEDEASEAGRVLVATPDNCPDCGAPWAPDADCKCRYCGHQLLTTVPA